METANEFIAKFISHLELRKKSLASVPCSALIADALPVQVQAMTRIHNQVCPSSLCNDVDRAIIGASLGG